MLKPPTTLPQPTQDNLSQYKPDPWPLKIFLFTIAAFIVLTLPFKFMGVKWGGYYWPLSLIWFFPLLSLIADNGFLKIWGLLQYRQNPVAYAQKIWARQEAHRRAYETEQQQLKTEAYWKGMSGFEFESNLCEVLISKGIKAELTKKTGDGGVDIWVSSKKGRIAIQCKAYKKQAGPAAVRELFGVVHGSKAIMGILVCTGGFTSGAIDFANSNKGIYLADLRDTILMAKGESKFLPSLY